MRPHSFRAGFAVDDVVDRQRAEPRPTTEVSTTDVSTTDVSTTDVSTTEPSTSALQLSGGGA
jgi:hypothetical protein